MAKRVGCARKICSAELEEVPPNAMAGNVVVEMPSVVARVGAVNVPTTGYLDISQVRQQRGFFAHLTEQHATDCIHEIHTALKINQVDPSLALTFYK